MNQENTQNINDLYYMEVGCIPSLSGEKEKGLREAVVSGAISRENGIERLIKGNLRLVVKIASKYTDKGMPLEDLVQAGNVGLIEASNNYDWSRDCPFTSFATHYIKKEIILCLRQANIVVTPEKEYYLIKKYERYISENDIPTSKASMRRCAEELGVTIRKLKQLISGELKSPICSGLYDKRDKELEIEDLSFNEDILCEHCDSSSLIEETANELPRKEKELLFLYYGIGVKRLNYEQIGKKYRKNKQWAHREVQKAIVLLQSSPAIQAYSNRKAV